MKKRLVNLLCVILLFSTNIIYLFGQSQFHHYVYSEAPIYFDDNSKWSNQLTVISKMKYSH
jgi:hypothetical protein